MAYTAEDFAIDFTFCPLCDNYVERAECDECGDSHCSACLEAYGCAGCE